MIDKKVSYFQALQLAIIAILASLVGYVFTHYKSMELWLIVVSVVVTVSFVVANIILSIIILKKIDELEDL